MNRRMRVSWVLAAGLLLLVAASRLVRLDDLIMNRDEIWSVWQTFGTPQQIIQWTPYDWPPGYYLTLAAWRSVAGSYPLALRVFSVLAFLCGAAALFRLMRRWSGTPAAVLTTLAYAALGFGIQLSLEVRGYALLLGLLPLALWLTVRYFDHPRWPRAIWLALVLAAMFYISLTSVGAFAMIGLFTLVVYGRAVWRWWLPGVVAGALAAPEILSKSAIATSRVAATQTLTPPPLPQALLELYRDYAGFTFGLWAILFIIAAVLLIYRAPARRHIAALFIWVALMPLALYLLNPVLGFFSPRYAWWIIPGIALWVGWGLSCLPRAGRLISAAVLAGVLFYPLPTSGPYQIWDNLSPLGTNFAWLRDHLQGGDVVLDNISNTCGALEEWDYYLKTYFPNGLKFVSTPGDHRRLWVLNPDRLPLNVETLISTAYIPGRFVGPPGCLFRLYEAPPDIEGILFENGMRFHGVDVLQQDQRLSTSGRLVRREGENVRLRMWWSVDYPPDLDYSISTYLERRGRVFSQLDSPPAAVYPPGAPQETSRWQPGRYYIEERDLPLPLPAAGSYAANLVVYFWADPVPIPAPGVDERGHLPLLRVTVQSY